jgi:glycosyltransferase involved in cell wall biosynthesis
MSEPVVSVAMSVHNGAATVASAIRSILWQTFPRWELILFNDASLDATASIVDQFRDPRIRVIHARDRKGLPARLNECVDLACGRYIARMDADDISYPERFQRQVEYLESHQDIDLLGHGAVLFKGSGEVVGLYPISEQHEDICRQPWWGFPLAHPTWMGRRTWFLKDRYDQRLRKGQDQELLLRTWQKSRFASLPLCLLGYRLERISAVKSALGRMAYCRRLLLQVHDMSSFGWALRGISVHTAGLARDVLLDTTGRVSDGARRSFMSADEVVRKQWQTIWNQVSETA